MNEVFQGRVDDMIISHSGILQENTSSVRNWDTRGEHRLYALNQPQGLIDWHFTNSIRRQKLDLTLHFEASQQLAMPFESCFEKENDDSSYGCIYRHGLNVLHLSDHITDHINTADFAFHRAFADTAFSGQTQISGLFHQLNGWARLSDEQWDAEDSDPLTKQACARAGQILHLMSVILLPSLKGGYPNQRVEMHASRDGGVVIIFIQNENELHFSIDFEGLVELVVVDASEVEFDRRYQERGYISPSAVVSEILPYLL